ARSGGQTPTQGKDQPTSRIGNKGVECALAALEMVNLLRQLPPEQPNVSPGGLSTSRRQSSK
ncbi:MAG TPA: hypothetical protein PK777_02765, partial [Thermoguttaceae bacterium]|nr:hypothetical protein [Thermoguttaceae bacterium]